MTFKLWLIFCICTDAYLIFAPFTLVVQGDPKRYIKTKITVSHVPHVELDPRTFNVYVFLNFSFKII